MSAGIRFLFSAARAQPSRRTLLWGNATLAAEQPVWCTACTAAVLAGQADRLLLHRRGTGRMTINGKALDAYFGQMQRRLDVLTPMYTTATLGAYDTYATVAGGGMTGQAQVLCSLVK